MVLCRQSDEYTQIRAYLISSSIASPHHYNVVVDWVRSVTGEEFTSKIHGATFSTSEPSIRGEHYEEADKETDLTATAAAPRAFDFTTDAFGLLSSKSGDEEEVVVEVTVGIVVAAAVFVVVVAVAVVVAVVEVEKRLPFDSGTWLLTSRKGGHFDYHCRTARDSTAARAPDPVSIGSYFFAYFLRKGQFPVSMEFIRSFHSMASPDITHVFAYASLMWDASSILGIERVLPGTLKGYSREMCIKSFIYRGTREKPGLCMGLLRCPDGECEGMVLQLDQAQLADTLQRIDRRELVMGAYTRERVIVLADGEEIPCYTYVVNRAADNYTGDISDEEKTRQGTIILRFISRWLLVWNRSR
ncbi:hypothetical protein FOZ62_022491 [Perkinsus olseni]|uniref:glutathione-specific gamma-glutamylcyclotransferase n=1 Tax=Perkinsus olseni TaxID=32597 RepID=A0A7J6QQT6_PEROL|nr:hypothetical protein FOZ62_022491 [Perkinsus olseni]